MEPPTPSAAPAVGLSEVAAPNRPHGEPVTVGANAVPRISPLVYDSKLSYVVSTVCVLLLIVITLPPVSETTLGLATDPPTTFITELDSITTPPAPCEPVMFNTPELTLRVVVLATLGLERVTFVIELPAPPSNVMV